MPESLFTQIVLGEIVGKNTAIHAYDKLMWTVRSGFLTLFFAAWGLLFKSWVDESTLGVVQLEVAAALLALSAALASGAHAIDVSYARRKFRVVRALNGLISETARSHGFDTSPNDMAAVLPYLIVSGDTGDQAVEESGFSAEKRVADLIYWLPVGGLAIGLVIIASVHALLFQTP